MGAFIKYRFYSLLELKWLWKHIWFDFYFIDVHGACLHSTAQILFFISVGMQKADRKSLKTDAKYLTQGNDFSSIPVYSALCDQHTSLDGRACPSVLDIANEQEDKL